MLLSKSQLNFGSMIMLCSVHLSLLTFSYGAVLVHQLHCCLVYRTCLLAIMLMWWHGMLACLQDAAAALLVTDPDVGRSAGCMATHAPCTTHGPAALHTHTGTCDGPGLGPGGQCEP